jgi:hypothetical protein
MLFTYYAVLGVAGTYQHYSRSKEDPTNIPELAGTDIHHLLNAVYEFLRPEYPRNCDGLEEADP